MFPLPVDYLFEKIGVLVDYLLLKIELAVLVHFGGDSSEETVDKGVLLVMPDLATLDLDRQEVPGVFEVFDCVFVLVASTVGRVADETDPDVAFFLAGGTGSPVVTQGLAVFLLVEELLLLAVELHPTDVSLYSLETVHTTRQLVHLLLGRLLQVLQEQPFLLALVQHHLLHVRLVVVPVVVVEVVELLGLLFVPELDQQGRGVVSLDHPDQPGGALVLS